MDDGRISEAEMPAVAPFTPSSARAKQPEPYAASFLGISLHVRLVELHHVGARREQVLDLFIHRRRIVERQFFLAA